VVATAAIDAESLHGFPLSRLSSGPQRVLLSSSIHRRAAIGHKLTIANDGYP
jgi:hypothetical protein